MSRKIEEILAKRGDLSTFLVHLTRSKDDLISILQGKQIESRNTWGMLNTFLNKQMDIENGIRKKQKCVCFTETPLEFLWSLCEGVEACDHHPPSNYGIVITKRQARKSGVNPVWYIDQTPGHDWLSEKTINPMIKKALETQDWENGIFKITPFFEIMGSWPGKSPKEFCGNGSGDTLAISHFQKKFITICPEENDGHHEIKSIITAAQKEPHLIDSKWSMEEMVANLAHFDKDKIRHFVTPETEST